MSESRQTTLQAIKPALLRCFETQRPAFLWGPPGVGKSELIDGITKELGGHMIDLRLGQLDPTDVRGIPFFNKELGVMDWAPPIDLPTQELADKYPLVVLFLDEMNSAPPSVLAAAYQLILNRGVGKYVLPSNVVMVAAGNRETDKGVTFRMPSPLSNRFVHFEVKVDFESWLNWAVKNKIHKDVVGYLNFAKNDLYDFDPKSSSRAFATPRSWAFVSELIDDGGTVPTSTVTDLVAGTVGEGLALKFIAHRKVAAQMPNPSDILEGKVHNISINDISAQYSLVTSLCYELQDAIEHKVKDEVFHKMADHFFRFIMDNFETEIVIMASRVALTTYELPILPRRLTHFDEFHKRFGKYIVQATQ